MTSLNFNAMTLPMLRNSFLWLCLLVMSLVASTTLHARELPGLTSIECTGTVHAGSEQQPSSDSPDKGMAHHHGCHSASSFLPSEGPFSYSFDPPLNLVPAASATVLSCWQSGPDLRPPIA